MRKMLILLMTFLCLGTAGCSSGANDSNNSLLDAAFAEYNMAIKMDDKLAAAAQADKIARLYIMKKEYDTAENWKRTAQRHRGR